MKKLILHIEKQIWPASDLDKCLNVVCYAVGTYNSRLTSVIGTDHPESLTGLEWLREIINRNDFDKFDFNFGFSGSHFWMHNLKNERAILVTEVEV